LNTRKDLMAQKPVARLVDVLAGCAAEVVDLTHPLDESTPAIRLPETFAGTPGLDAHEISRYDRWGSDWACGGSSSGSTSEPTAARQTCRAAARRSSSHRSSLEAGRGDRQPGSVYAFVSRDPLSRTRSGDLGVGSEERRIG
jgi:hypothetical protein